jgi:hypothetical protein
MRVAPTTSNTQNFWISQSLETHEVIRLAGKQVTLSFYHRMPFAFTGTWSAAVSFSTGTDANLHYPAASTGIFAENLSGTAAWQRYTRTFTVPANATSLAIQFQTTNNVLNTSMFDLTGVQLEIGSVATDFSRAGGNIQGELAACQRYYWRSESGSGEQKFAQGPAYASGYLISNPINLPVSMRVKPTSLDYGGSLWLQRDASQGGNNITSIGVMSAYSNTKQVVLDIQVASGLTAGTYYELKANNSTNAYIGLNAEL